MSLVACRRAILALTALAAVAQPVAASTITNVHQIVGPGLGLVDVAIVTSVPNNDDAGVGNPNIITISKSFDRVAPIDIVFSVSNSVDVVLRATTEYLIRDTVLNNTGESWRELDRKSVV